MTTISRDRIYFEYLGDEVADGNEQSHRDQAAREWAGAASAYLERNGGGKATVGYGRDLNRFSVTGDKATAEAADDAGHAAARAYVNAQIAEIEKATRELA